MAPAMSAVADAFVVRVGGEDHDLDLWVLGSEPPGRLDAVGTRHAQVHEHNLRPFSASQRYRLVAVGGLADDADVALVVRAPWPALP